MVRGVMDRQRDSAFEFAELPSPWQWRVAVSDFSVLVEVVHSVTSRVVVRRLWVSDGDESVSAVLLSQLCDEARAELDEELSDDRCGLGPMLRRRLRGARAS